MAGPKTERADPAGGLSPAMIVPLPRSTRHQPPRGKNLGEIAGQWWPCGCGMHRVPETRRKMEKPIDGAESTAIDPA